MTKIKLGFNTSDMILYHLLQRFIYQYHSLFSTRKNHPSIDDLTALWYIKIFSDNDYFNNMPNSVIVEYNILENKDLSIIIKAPLYTKTFLISLDKEIKSCVTYADSEGTIENVDIFSIEYE